MKIITAVNESDVYIHFIPSVTQSWNEMFGFDSIIAFVTEREESDPLVMEMREYSEVILYKPIEGVPTGNQAKVCRMYLASESEEDVIIVDLDMYMLNKPVFENWLSELEEGKILTIGYNAYIGSPSEEKFPMCYTMGNGKLFKESINPDSMSYTDLLLSWCSIKNPIDGKESLNQPHSNFSDESLYRYLIEKTNTKDLYKHFHRDDFVGMRATKRIDRYPSMNYSIKDLFSGNYIDCAPTRPIDYNKMIPIFEHLNIDMNRIKFKNK